jgi:HK97 family phage major capsid protein
LQYASAFLSVGPRVWESPTGSPGSYPIATSDTSNSAVQIGENSLVSESDVTIAKIVFPQAPLYTSGIVRAARLLVQDAGFPLQAFLIDVFSKRLARGLDSAAATVALAASWANVTTTASNTAITYTDLANVVFSIDPAYLASASCGWIVNPTVALKLKTTLDSSNRPVLLDAPYRTTTEYPIGGSNRSMVIGTMLGFPVYMSKNLPTFAAGKANVALFGDWDHALVWRQVQRDEVTVLVERYADLNEVAFLSFARHDFAAADLNAVGALNVHA